MRLLISGRLSDLNKSIMNNYKYFFACVYFSFMALAWSGYTYAQGQEQTRSPLKGERLFMHIDKSFYMPGEILWFKAYLSDLSSGGQSTVSNVAYVELLDHAQESVLQTKFELGPGTSNGGSLYLPAHLPSGDYTVVAYTSLIKNHRAVPIYSQVIELLNPYLDVTTVDQGADGGPPRKSSLGSMSQRAQENPLAIEGTLGKTLFATREKVDVTIQTFLNNQSAPADLSISVYRADALENEPNGSPFFSVLNTENSETLISSVSGLPEQRYHQVAFRLNDKVTKQPLAKQNVFLSVPGTRAMLYTGETDTAGRVVFYVKELYGTNQLAIRLESGQESDVELISPFFTGYESYASAVNVGQPTVYEAELQDLILERSLNVQTENSYFSKDRARFKDYDLDSLPFFGHDAVVYHLDDYTRFVLMEEVLREYVTEVRLQRRGGDYRFRVLDVGYGYYFNQSPLVLIDGVPISNENDIVAFDPLKIEKISIVTGRYYLGNGVYEGVVSFSTYGGDLADFPLDNSVTMIEYEGLQKERIFFSPIHDGNEKRWERMPDTRNLLYWNSSVKVGQDTAANLSFYTSDVEGDYVVVINGQSESGKLGSTVLKFSVRE